MWMNKVLNLNLNNKCYYLGRAVASLSPSESITSYGLSGSLKITS